MGVGSTNFGWMWVHIPRLSGPLDSHLLPHPVALSASASRPLRPRLPRSSPGEGQPQPAPTPCPQSLPPLPAAGSPARLSQASSRAEGAESGGTKVRPPSAGGRPALPRAAAGALGGQTRRWPHLFLQRLLGRERRLGGGRAVADAALQQVEPRGPRARVALEVEEQVLQQREPLGLPFCVVRTPFAQVAFARAVLARQQSQGRDVAIVQPDPLLHGARRPARPHALTSFPRGPRQPPVRARGALPLSGARSLAPGRSPLPPNSYTPGSGAEPRLLEARCTIPRRNLFSSPQRPGAPEMPSDRPPARGKLRDWRAERGRGAGGVM